MFVRKVNYKYPNCDNPIPLKGVGLVSCGRCRACLLRKKKDWISRCMCESRTCGATQYITLTYDENNIMYGSYKDVINFIKSLRMKASRAGKSFKYFGCCEYGEKHNRMHYHLVLFGYSIVLPKKYKELGWTLNEYVQRKYWHHGFTKILPCNDGAFRYIAGYVMKKMEAQVNRSENISIKDWNYLQRFSCPCDDVIEKMPFCFYSKGIGFQYFRKHVKRIIEKGFLCFNGYRYAVPKAFIDLLNKDERFSKYKDLYSENETENPFFTFCWKNWCKDNNELLREFPNKFTKEWFFGRWFLDICKEKIYNMYKKLDEAEAFFSLKKNSNKKVVLRC